MKNNLKKHRQKAGLSLQALGDLCGRSKAQIHQIENYASAPRLDTAYLLATVLGVSVYDIWPNTIKVVEETITVRRAVMQPQDPAPESAH